MSNDSPNGMSPDQAAFILKAEAPAEPVEHLEPPTEREILVALVACALDDPDEFGVEDVVEILKEHGRGDIIDEARELNEIELGELGLDDLPEDDPEPEDEEP